MVFWEIVKALLGGKKEKEEPRTPALPDPTMEELKREIEQVKSSYFEAKQTVKKALKEDPNNHVLRRFYEVLTDMAEDYAGEGYRYFPAAALLIHLAAAVEKGLHRDPEKLIQYMIVAADKTARAIVRRIEKPHPDHVKPALRKLGYDRWTHITDYSAYMNAIYTALRGMHYGKYRKALHHLYIGSPSWWEYAERYGHHEYKTIDPIGKKYLPEIWGKDPEDFLPKEEEEEKLAPKLVAKILEERLPGAAYRLAVLLHAHEEGAPLTPKELENIIDATTSPHKPQGTQHYNLIYRMLERLEHATTTGQQPPKPTALLETLLREAMQLKPYQDLQQKLAQAAQGKRNAEILLLKKRLGIPGRHPEIAKTLLNLLNLTRQIEQGKLDPYLADTRSEMSAIARHIEAQPREPTQEYLQRINPQTLEYLFNHIHREFTEKATQLGRETALQTLNKALQHAKKAMEKHKDKPYPELVAATIREVVENLKKELGPNPTPEQATEARWASLAVQHLLTALPIHVAETREELGMAKHLLTQGYSPEEYDVPLVLDAMNYMSRLGSLGDEERKRAVVELRDAIQVAESVKTAAWRTLQAHREERAEPRELARNTIETIETIMRTKK